MQIEDVIESHQDELMSIQDVVGIGVGESMGHPVIVVMVKKLSSEIKTLIPSSLDNFAVKLEVTGEIGAY